MYSINLSTEAKIFITSLLFYLPLSFSNFSLRGFLIAIIFYLITGISKEFKALSIKYIPRLLIASIIVWSAFTIPRGLILIFDSSFSGFENLAYAFKQFKILGYDANYIGTILLIFAINKTKKIYMILLLFTGNRASIISFLFLQFLKLFKIKAYKYAITYIFLFSIVLILTATLYDGNKVILTEIIGKSAAYKIQTIRNLVDVISIGDFNTLFFGDGISFLIEEGKGHTLAGVIVNNGLFYAVYSLLIFFFSINFSREKDQQIFFAVFFVALFSTTSFIFVSPLAYALSKQSFMEKESNKNKLNKLSNSKTSSKI